MDNGNLVYVRQTNLHEKSHGSVLIQYQNLKITLYMKIIKTDTSGSRMIPTILIRHFEKSAARQPFQHGKKAPKAMLPEDGIAKTQKKQNPSATSIKKK